MTTLKILNVLFDRFFNQGGRPETDVKECLWRVKLAVKGDVQQDVRTDVQTGNGVCEGMSGQDEKACRLQPETIGEKVVTWRGKTTEEGLP